MSVDSDRQATARDRRAAIIAALREHFDVHDPASRVSRFRTLVEAPRDPDSNPVLVANADIDGLVSAHMLSSVTGWTIGALVHKQGRVVVHPSVGSLSDLVDRGLAFGVDLFSPLFPSVSNHPVYFAPGPRQRTAHLARLRSFDDAVRDAATRHGAINPSEWVTISATQDSTGSPAGLSYKYPLGTAQVMLALLELAGFPPRLYDRQFLPYLIANCDGGLDTIRRYAWNAEMWWSALAASVGPASLSEAIYDLATNQRPSEFADADHRLRLEEPERARHLTSQWNLRSPAGTAGSLDHAIAEVTGLISDLSGWGDPFKGGVETLSVWTEERPTQGGLRTADLRALSDVEVDSRLSMAERSAHLNFSTFRERGVQLSWLMRSLEPGLGRVVGEGLGEADPEAE